MNARTVVVDILVIAALIVLVNLIFFPHDPGFLSLPLNPWLVLAVLLGARHGMAVGVGGAILSALLLWGSANAGESSLEISILLERPMRLVVVGWIILGAVVGSVLDAERKTSKEKVAELDKLRRSEENLRSENYLLESENAELRRKVLGATDTVSTIYDMARGLITLEGRDLYQASLELVERHTGANCCALLLDNHGELKLIESRGTLPPSFQPERSGGMVLQALRERRVVTLREVPDDEGCALSLPLIPPDHEQPIGVLAVPSIPLERLNAQTQKTLELLADWTARALELVWKIQNLNETEESDALVRRLSKSLLPPTALSTLTELGGMLVPPVVQLALNEEANEIAHHNCATILQRLGTRAKLQQSDWQKVLRPPLERAVLISGQLKTLPMRRDLVGCKGLRKRLEWRLSLARRTIFLLLEGLAQDAHQQELLEALPKLSSPHPSVRAEGISLLKQRVDESIDIGLGFKAARRTPGGREALLDRLHQSRDPWTRRFALISSGELNYEGFEQRSAEAMMSADPLWVEAAVLGESARLDTTDELHQKLLKHDSNLVRETVLLMTEEVEYAEL